MAEMPAGQQMGLPGLKWTAAAEHAEQGASAAQLELAVHAARAVAKAVAQWLEQAAAAASFEHQANFELRGAAVDAVAAETLGNAAVRA